MNDELGRISKQAIAVACFKELSQNVPGRTEENNKKHRLMFEPGISGIRSMTFA